MTTKSIERYCWIAMVIFVTYLFIGSFLVSKNFLDIVYLIILYSVIIIVKIVSNKK